jgi:hypothetical protein
MPVKRRRSKRRGDIDPAEWSYLLDEPMPDDTWGSMAYFALDVDASGRTTTIWSTHGDAAVKEYARNNPGKRPRLWWLYNAPEQRRRLSDTPMPWEPVWGKASCLHVNRFERGIPCDADEDDFETEAAYLERLGLLLTGERERL